MTDTSPDPTSGDLERLLRTLEADDRHVQVPQHVHAAVMQVWDATSHARPRRRAHLWQWRTASIAGIVACGVVVSVLSVLRHRPEPAAANSIPVAKELPRSTASGSQRPLERRSTDVKAAPGERRAPSPRRQVRNARHAARTTRPQVGMVLVADPAADAGTLSVLRVRVPRSALINLGIPIGDPEAAGSVDLELLVGEDGVARAIRRATPVAVSDPED